MTRHVTIALDEDVIAAAEAAGVDLAEVLSRALRRSLPELQESEQAAANTKWRQQNREAIQAVNRLIEDHGLFSDGMRMF
jgi:antitoxin CcdA